jgi:hypothetical protein
LAEFNISYTLLSTYKRCRHRCWLQLIRRLIPRDKVDNRPFIVGIVADWLFENWVKAGYPEGWMEEKAESLFIWWTKKRRFVFKGQDDKRKLIFKTKNAARRMEMAAFDHNLPDRKVMTQVRWEFKEGGLLYKGKVDIFFPEENTIWDLKITESKRYLDPFQLHFFGWLAHKCGIDVEKLAFFSPMMKKVLHEHEWNTLILHETEKEINDLMELINDEQWQRTAKDCWACPVMRFCEDESPISYAKKNERGGFNIDL